MLAKELQQRGEQCLDRTAGTLQERIALVKRLVGTNFQGYDEGRLRNLEWTVLQMLAPLCSPPRHVVPTEITAIVHLVLQAKQEIDELEQMRVGLAPGKPEPSMPLWEGLTGLTAGNVIRPVSRPDPPTPPPTPTMYKPMARKPSVPLAPTPEEDEWQGPKPYPVGRP